MTTKTNPFISPTAGDKTATTEDRIAVLENTIYRALDDLKALSTPEDNDTTYLVAKVLAGVKRSTDTRYKAIRKALWQAFGAGKHATPGGRSFSFTRPSTSRSCDYATLEQAYPEVYDAVVTVKQPANDAIGTLRLLTK